MMAAALVVLAVVLALTGPDLAAGYSAGIAGCTAETTPAERFFDRFFDGHQRPSWPSASSCWPCPP